MDSTQHLSTSSIRGTTTSIQKYIISTATFPISHLTNSVHPSFTLDTAITSKFHILQTSHLITTNYHKIKMTLKTYTVQINQTGIISSPCTSYVTHITTTPEVNSTSFPPSGILSTTKNPKKKNLVILYATIFSVVGFILVVIIAVVVVGCRRSEVKGAFKFSQQLDHELGTFEEIPRAKFSNTHESNVALNVASISRDGIPNGQVTEIVLNSSSAGDEISKIFAPAECNKTIENRAYDNTALDPDDENS